MPCSLLCVINEEHSTCYKHNNTLHSAGLKHEAQMVVFLDHLEMVLEMLWIIIRPALTIINH
jgi:hypothetical protein